MKQSGGDTNHSHPVHGHLPKNDYIDELNDTSGSVVSASEQQFMRRRRRRGVLPPSKRGGNNDNISMRVTKANNDNYNHVNSSTIFFRVGVVFHSLEM